MNKLNKWLLPAAMIVAMLITTANAMADGVVAIVNNANTSADKATIGKLFTGRAKSWSNGDRAKLYDLSDQGERDAFCNTYTGKDAGAIKAIWAQAVFAGRGVPPEVLSSDDAVKKAVASEKNAVGYIKESSVDSTVKVVR